MRMLNVLLSVVLAIALVTSAHAGNTEPPTGFRDMKWGVPPFKTFKKIMGPTSDGTSMYVPVANSYASFLGVPVAEEGYSYTYGKLYMGNVYIDGKENLEKVRLALENQFGPPTFVNERLSLWKWKWVVKKIEIHLNYQAKFSRTTVTYINDGI